MVTGRAEHPSCAECRSRAEYRSDGARGFLTVAALVAILAGTGCKPAGDAAKPPAPASGSQHPKVALVMKSLANNFFATMADGARRHQAEHAADYELSVAGIKNETDLNEQVNLVEQAVAQGAVAIVIGSDLSGTRGRPALRSSTRNSRASMR